MRPVQIISGGQTGADQGAVVAAKQLGIATGGWMPRGFLTECGPEPSLGFLYGFKEHPSASYPPRTRRNVKDADGTLWVSADTTSPGYRCTSKAADDYEKPFLCNPTPEELRAWVIEHQIKILNVAGPRASRVPKIHTTAAQLIIDAFMLE